MVVGTLYVVLFVPTLFHVVPSSEYCHKIVQEPVPPDTVAVIVRGSFSQTSFSEAKIEMLGSG